MIDDERAIQLRHFLNCLAIDDDVLAGRNDCWTTDLT